MLAATVAPGGEGMRGGRPIREGPPLYISAPESARDFLQSLGYAGEAF